MERSYSIASGAVAAPVAAPVAAAVTAPVAAPVAAAMAAAVTAPVAAPVAAAMAAPVAAAMAAPMAAAVLKKLAASAKVPKWMVSVPVAAAPATAISDEFNMLAVDMQYKSCTNKLKVFPVIPNVGKQCTLNWNGYIARRGLPTPITSTTISGTVLTAPITYTTIRGTVLTVPTTEPTPSSLNVIFENPPTAECDDISFGKNFEMGSLLTPYMGLSTKQIIEEKLGCGLSYSSYPAVADQATIDKFATDLLIKVAPYVKITYYCERGGMDVVVDKTPLSPVLLYKDENSQPVLYKIRIAKIIQIYFLSYKEHVLTFGKEHVLTFGTYAEFGHIVNDDIYYVCFPGQGMKCPETNTGYGYMSELLMQGTSTDFLSIFGCKERDKSYYYDTSSNKIDMEFDFMYPIYRKFAVGLQYRSCNNKVYEFPVVNNVGLKCRFSWDGYVSRPGYPILNAYNNRLSSVEPLESLYTDLFTMYYVTFENIPTIQCKQFFGEYTETPPAYGWTARFHSDYGQIVDVFPTLQTGCKDLPVEVWSTRDCMGHGKMLLTIDGVAKHIEPLLPNGPIETSIKFGDRKLVSMACVCNFPYIGTHCEHELAYCGARLISGVGYIGGSNFSAVTNFTVSGSGHIEMSTPHPASACNHVGYCGYVLNGVWSVTLPILHTGVFYDDLHLACSCNPKYGGDQCEHTNDCPAVTLVSDFTEDVKTCSGHGKCGTNMTLILDATSRVVKYGCVCEDGWKGDVCEVRIDTPLQILQTCILLVPPQQLRPCSFRDLVISDKWTTNTTLHLPVTDICAAISAELVSSSQFRQTHLSLRGVYGDWLRQQTTQPPGNICTYMIDSNTGVVTLFKAPINGILEAVRDNTYCSLIGPSICIRNTCVYNETTPYGTFMTRIPKDGTGSP